MLYAILNENNFATSIIEYETKLINKPSNYIEIEDNSVLHHKYLDGKWNSDTETTIQSISKPSLEERVSSIESVLKTFMGV
ncbi:hypothetical protein [Clostridium saccharobutylicum]|uniref:Uncharacterized protein n=1 Tax=Clostridium saccharobutylicum DSM 13864 TaxID=1345695 RepID=U5MWY7_CLOSA|nr:hypothetical protein [Clostridium saccharobutylicum]AGX43942.1 hypothetical protein CLSA_c29750 [Clostridium saccharobutylicum DSM 13864]AQR91240.1 hypothetical protein CLOSC_29640 [Clostridium saccharobutylicum]AQS01144.1 hypothetical protein CSACC_29710 [Clostridium saccharobutylicum]AQS15127.1 hypothetical protein CLOSACC_29710 [Clostridium saccharobutylicum]MBA2905253.1 hypothetical protein [Clostridium saccharobutylicum]